MHTFNVMPGLNQRFKKMWTLDQRLSFTFFTPEAMDYLHKEAVHVLSLRHSTGWLSSCDNTVSLAPNCYHGVASHLTLMSICQSSMHTEHFCIQRRRSKFLPNNFFNILSFPVSILNKWHWPQDVAYKLLPSPEQTCRKSRSGILRAVESTRKPEISKDHRIMPKVKCILAVLQLIHFFVMLREYCFLIRWSTSRDSIQPVANLIDCGPFIWVIPSASFS